MDINALKKLAGKLVKESEALTLRLAKEEKGISKNIAQKKAT